MPTQEAPIPPKRKQVPRAASRNASPALDAIDLAILRHLTARPNLAIRGLARRVRMSPPIVSERVLRLKEAGVIRREWLEVDPQSLGLGVAAHVRVRPMPGGLAKIVKLAQSTPQAVERHRATGEWRSADPDA